MAKVQVIGGAFQDAQGNVLANGYLIFELSQDEQATGAAQIGSGRKVQINLNSSGSIDQSVAQFIWPNDLLAPVNSFYKVSGYNASGQLVWGPNNQQVISTPSPYDVTAWVPNKMVVWTPPVTALTLQTNEVNNGSQAVLDLHAGTNVTLADNGAGRVTIAAQGVAGNADGNSYYSGAGTFNNPNCGGIIVAQVEDINSYQFWGTRFGPPSYNGTASVTWLAATATENPMIRCATGALASTNCFGLSLLASGSTNIFPLGQLRRWSARLRLNQTTNVRYWIGLCYTAGGAPGTTTLASDAPIAQMVMFRYSAGVDSTIQCVCATDATHQSIVNTSVAVDTANSHLFEITYGAGTASFWIDGALVGQISTNVPAASQGLGTVWTVDNKNTANSQSVDNTWFVWQRK